MDYLQQAKFSENRSRYLSQIAKMDADLKEYVEKKGGKEKLSDQEKGYFAGREKGLIVLANYDDAATEYIQLLESVIEELAQENRFQRIKINDITGQERDQRTFRQKNRDLLAVTVVSAPVKVPYPLAAFLNVKTAKRYAIENQLRNDLPELF